MKILILNTKGLILLALLPLYLGISCDNLKTKFKLNKRWEVTKTQGGTTLGFYENRHIVDNSVLMIASNEKPNEQGLDGFPRLLNLSDGKKVIDIPNLIISSATNVYVHNNTLMVLNEPNLTSANLTTGAVNWTKTQKDYDVYGDGEDYYIISDKALYTGKVDNPNLTLLSTFPDRPNGGDFYARQLNPFKHQGKKYVAFGYGYINRNTFVTEFYIGLFDVEAKQWIYQKQIRSDEQNSIAGSSTLFNGTLYFETQRFLIAFDVLTGEEKWRYPLPYSGAPSFVVSEKAVIVNTLESNLSGLTHALNPMTGSLTWKTPSGGNALKPFIMDDVVYFTDDGDGYLYAKDLNTGKDLIKMRCPCEKERSSDGWGSAVIGKDGVIYVDSMTKSYAFEVIKP